MGNGNIFHSGYLSYQKYNDTLSEYYTTQSEDEIIEFKDGTNNRFLNSLLIENNGINTMYIKPIESNYCIVIPRGESRTLDYVRISGIQVIGSSGQMLRWSGCFY